MKQGAKHWTAEQIDLLRQLYPTEKDQYHLEYKDERGKCSVWNAETLKEEYCSRGGLEDYD